MNQKENKVYCKWGGLQTKANEKKKLILICGRHLSCNSVADQWLDLTVTNIDVISGYQATGAHTTVI